MEVSWSCVAPTRGSSSEEMREGDVVMVYLGPEKVTSIHLTAGESFENKFGRFDHTSFIGAPFGGRVYSSRGHWVLALAPTPELWALALRHRTQIVQSMDSAMVAFELGLRDGSVLMEAGTGSGAATVAFARACAPTGRVHTFECNESRATEADADFERLGIGGGGVDDVVHKKEDDDHQGEEEQGRRMPENAAAASSACTTSTSAGRRALPLWRRTSLGSTRCSSTSPSRGAPWTSSSGEPSPRPASPATRHASNRSNGPASPSARPSAPTTSSPSKPASATSTSGPSTSPPSRRPPPKK
mmetsp:Transcript_7383/g.24335  ORF Transcript_7383/g.24335 Transcript_7383/m.24335 type:complete len:301 (-) Transcript_7383:224-1126(-)